MIHFRCPCCNRRYEVPAKKIGEKQLCVCGEMIRVPAYSGGSARYRTPGERLIEIVVYGCGGAILLFCLGLMPVYALGRWFALANPFTLLGWRSVLSVAAAGFLIGALGGEKGIDWIGRKIRDHDPSR
jgi:hypothetical protein